MLRPAWGGSTDYNKYPLFSLSITVHVFEILYGGILPNVSGRYKAHVLVGVTQRKKAPQRDTETSL